MYYKMKLKANYRWTYNIIFKNSLELDHIIIRTSTANAPYFIPVETDSSESDGEISESSRSQNGSSDSDSSLEDGISDEGR